MSIGVMIGGRKGNQPRHVLTIVEAETVLYVRRPYVMDEISMSLHRGLRPEHA